MLKISLKVIIGIAMLSYPFVVYWGLNNYGPAVLAILLFILLLLRFFLVRKNESRWQWGLLGFFALFCIAVVGLNSESLLRYYPVLMSIAVAAVFAFSLTTDMPIIERFARMLKKPPPSYAKNYLRNLTKIWSGLLVFNALVAGYTACCMSLQNWTLYNGILSYAFFAIFILLELIYRQFYKRKYAAMEVS